MSNERESPIKILLYLYSVIAGIASVTAVQFVVISPEGSVRNPFSQIQVKDLLSTLSFFCFLIPFYHGAVTYLNKTYVRGHQERTGELVVDYLHLFGESIVFYAISLSLHDITLLIAWLSILMIIDSIWIGLILLRRKEEKGQPHSIWLKLNAITFVFVLLLWLSYSVQPTIIQGIQGYTVLFVFSLFRTIYDYIKSTPFYFKNDNRGRSKSGFFENR